MKYEMKINLLGLYLFSALCVFTAIPVAVHFSSFDDKLIKSFILIACSGGMGGTIYSIRGFYQNIGEERFRLNWAWWYIFRPVISAIMGLFIYFLVAGGLMTLNLIPEVGFSKTLLFFCGLSFLAGFSFTEATSKLKKTASLLFFKNEKDKK